MDSAAVENPAPLRTYRSLPSITGTAVDIPGANAASGARSVQIRLARAGSPTMYLQADGTFAARVATVSAPVNGAGAWGMRVARPLAAGRYSLTATAIDAAGNASRVETTPFTIASTH